MGAIAAAMPDVAKDMTWDERQESYVGATPRMRELEALRI